MSDAEDIPPEEDLENPLRIVLVLDEPTSKESTMEERLLDSVQTFDSVNCFFDAFDEAVAIPNDGHIKYEVGSDGLVVIIVDNCELMGSVLEFVDSYEAGDEEEHNGGETTTTTKKKKTKKSA
ncbi:uncharacterized protein LODBEIA_P17530 [Lodderomyces beijingensis]|uniref:DUF1892 domain-containing protein n=1 Tax=Lodderomyces beijingensis TaxID=1775926 RepID=A0ABP0ZH90_9ASCO